MFLSHEGVIVADLSNTFHVDFLVAAVDCNYRSQRKHRIRKCGNRNKDTGEEGDRRSYKDIHERELVILSGAGGE